jgi:hypothetical protein
MNQIINNELEPELRKEYDFSQIQGGVRGKYAKEYQDNNNLVLLEPDIAKIFPTAESVNKALRLLMEIASRQQS